MFSLISRIGLPVHSALSAVEAIEAVRAVRPIRPEPRRSGAQRAYAEAASSERRRALTAADLMASPVIHLRPEASLAEARALFTERRFRHVPVVDRQERLVGLISDRDLLRATEESAGASVGAHMSSPVWTAAPETAVREIARLLFERRIGAMPIVDEGRLIGILTRSDLLRSLMTEAPLDLWVG